jgi:hypothetical protein
MGAGRGDAPGAASALVTADLDATIVIELEKEQAAPTGRIL